MTIMEQGDSKDLFLDCLVEITAWSRSPDTLLLVPWVAHQSPSTRHLPGAQCRLRSSRRPRRERRLPPPLRSDGPTDRIQCVTPKHSISPSWPLAERQVGSLRYSEQWH